MATKTVRRNTTFAKESVFDNPVDALQLIKSATDITPISKSLHKDGTESMVVRIYLQEPDQVPSVRKSSEGIRREGASLKHGLGKDRIVIPDNGVGIIREAK